MPDPVDFGGSKPQWDSPGQSLVAVTPSDSVNITGGLVRALWIGGDGDIAILAEQDTAAVTLHSAVAGTVIPVSTQRVFATGTTATNIVGIR